MCMRMQVPAETRNDRYFGARVTGGSKYPARVLETKLGSSDRAIHFLSH